jgi:D-sedoheptulose 7-phosphate isomerase
MAHLQPLAYLRELSALLLDTQVTDGQGNPMSIDIGMATALKLLQGEARPQPAGRPVTRKVLIIGNGGSAAIASHVHNDLCKAVGLRAMVFNEAPLLTALANDIDYASAFEKLVELWAEADDVLLAISSSGRSPNILRAARVCVERKCRVITFTGFQYSNPLRQMGDLNFYVSAHEYGFVEIAHSALLHFVTDQAAAARQQHQKQVAFASASLERRAFADAPAPAGAGVLPVNGITKEWR